MGIASAIVLYAVIWFVVLFVVLPIRLETQGDAGKRLIGTHAGSPANLRMKKKALLVSVIAFFIWAQSRCATWIGSIGCDRVLVNGRKCRGLSRTDVCLIKLRTI